MTVEDTKRQLRRSMRERRRKLDTKRRASCAHRLALNLLDALEPAPSARFACYLPNDGEMDLTPLIEQLWQRGNPVFLPVVHGPRLKFSSFESDTTLVENRFGIPEPDPATARSCPPSSLNTVLMPLVSFDHDGNRLGMGGGFYDKTFAFKRRARAKRTPRLIGVAFEFQRVDALPHNQWDVPLDAIVTEAGLRAFQRERSA